MRVCVCRIALGVATLAGVAPLARAQATLTGVVRDSAANAVAGAEVGIEALGRTTHADESGRYVLTGITPGMRLVRVRRVGFTSFSKLTQIVDGENHLPDVVLSRLVTKLDTVVSREQLLWREDPSLREFAENRKLGLGKFYTRDDLEKLKGRSISDAFEQLLSIQVVHAGRGSPSWIASTRPRSLSTECQHFEDLGPPTQQQRCGLCYMTIFLDNASLSTREVPNINRYLPEGLEALEIYADAAQVPPRYAGLNSQCGVAILHTRRPP